MKASYLNDSALEDVDRAVRPVSFDDFSGQSKVLGNLRVFVESARLRGEPLDHILFHGPPGLGKTTLANIVARELGVNLQISSGPVIEKAGDLAGILSNLGSGDVFFIDEIHRLSPSVEEFLYSAMEDFTIDILLDKGAAARSVKIELNPFTLIGATTRAGLLTSPLRARFGISCLLEYYDSKTLKGIIKRSSALQSIQITDSAALRIAQCSRGTPRVANSLLRRVRDFALVQGNGIVDDEITSYAFTALNIDALGLDAMDRKILSTLISKFSGGPVGLNTLSTALGEDPGTIEDVYEPYLIMQGLLNRTPRGRQVTALSYKHLGLEPSSPTSLF